MNVGKLLETVDSLVPLNSAFEDDFVGITIGSEDSEVNGLAVAHEIEHSILDYSISNNINTLITYHPPPLQKVFDEDGTEFFEDDTLTSKFREAGINIITVHTAQDVCKGGNADSLVDLFEINDAKIFAHSVGTFGAGRYGNIEKMSKNNYESFLYKIDQLNQLVELIKNSPEKYELIIRCKTHEDVVELAKQWGYEIGKRWGE